MSPHPPPLSTMHPGDWLPKTPPASSAAAETNGSGGCRLRIAAFFDRWGPKSTFPSGPQFIPKGPHSGLTTPEKAAGV